MNNINVTEKKALADLFYYVNNLHLSRKVCVFFDYSGHVDWISIKIVKSKEEWEKIIYERTIYLDCHGLLEAIIETRKSIRAKIENLAEAIQKVDKKLIEEEKTELKRLKNKYEGGEKI